jgi:hypothetical protein
MGAFGRTLAVATSAWSGNNSDQIHFVLVRAGEIEQNAVSFPNLGEFKERPKQRTKQNPMQKSVHMVANCRLAIEDKQPPPMKPCPSGTTPSNLNCEVVLEQRLTF